jgi:hypothetical protein
MLFKQKYTAMPPIKKTLEDVYNRVKKALNKLTTNRKPQPKLAWQRIKQNNLMRGTD